MAVRVLYTNGLEGPTAEAAGTTGAGKVAAEAEADRIVAGAVSVRLQGHTFTVRLKMFS